jgi:hypothetical protein
MAALAVDFATVLCASERGDRAAAAVALRHAERHSGSDDVGISSDGIALLEMRALVLRAGAKREEAAALLRRAAEMEEKLPYEFGPPDPAKPPRDALLDGHGAGEGQPVSVQAMLLALSLSEPAASYAAEGSKPE